MTGHGPSVRLRTLLFGGAAAVGGTAVLIGDRMAGGAAAPAVAQNAADDAPTRHGLGSVAFHGEHQAGVDTLPAQAHAVFLGLDLRPGTDSTAVRRLLRLLGDDADRLMSGRPPLGAEDPELPALPSRLTVTFGFGPGLFDAIGRPGDCPAVIRNLPAFATDRLEDRWSGGDLLVQVCSDDALPLSYAVRRLVRDARAGATVRWTQRGFNPARGSEPAGTTPRNLMGQRDGSANAPAGSTRLADALWVREGPDWLVGGCMLVLRRIRMDLDIWDDFGRQGKEMAVARRLEDGSPVTGGGEFDKVDPRMVDGQGFPIAVADSHALRATARTPGCAAGSASTTGPRPTGSPTPDCCSRPTRPTRPPPSCRYRLGSRSPT